ncbi:MAG: ThuA domain-containing protein [Pirellulales bacterium]
MDDGRVLTGVLRNENGMLYLGDEKGNSTRIPRDEIQSLKVATTSIMPKGLLEKLSPDQVRDLMTYLLTPPPKMPLHSPLKAPPLRSQKEVDEVLAGSKELATPFKRLTICLIAGDKDHGPGEHDYPAWQQAWRALLDAAPEVDVELAWGFPSDDQLDRAKLLVFFQKGTWNAERANKMDRYFAKGGGATYIHWAVNGEDQVQEMSNRIGLASRGGAIKFRHGPLTLDLHHTDHPILRNMKDHLELYDESYWLLTGAPDRITLLASSLEEGEARPQVWTYDRGQGRVFGCIPGHYSWTFDDPLFRILLLRGMAWSANEPIDRFNELVPLGARMQR